MPGTTDRLALHAYLSPEAHEAWTVYSESNGVSITGLLEALGLDIKDELGKADADEIRQPWVKQGRKVDAVRRRRTRG